MGKKLPTIFISHGTPLEAIERNATVDFFSSLGAALDACGLRPKSILAVSAHWETPAPAVSSAAKPETIYDFYNFPPELYQITYDAPGAPQLAARVSELLGQADMPCAQDPAQGLDHGSWVPLKVMYPDADIPVAQLAVQHNLGPAHHLAMGRALAPLRDEGVLILGLGSMTHNMEDSIRYFRDGSGAGLPPDDWARDFDQWVEDTLLAERYDALSDYRDTAPGAVMAHPRDEHFLPLPVAAGAGEGSPPHRIYKDFMFRNLAVAGYVFGDGFDASLLRGTGVIAA